MSAQPPSGQPLLLVIDPAARVVDGESVRVAKDVLCAGAPVPVKITLPEAGEDLHRVLAHRGRRRPVVVGDDRALHRVVQALHHRRELSLAPVSHIPVGPPATIPLALALGLPTHPAPAARAALAGPERALDLLVDDRGGVVLDAVEISGPALYGRGLPPEPEGVSLGHGTGAGGNGNGGGSSAWWDSVGRGARTLARGLRVQRTSQLPRLRVEADGVMLAGLSQPLQHIAVYNAGPGRANRATRKSHGRRTGESTGGSGQGRPDDGLVEVEVRMRPTQRGSVRMTARSVTVSGRNFGYAADGELTGPVLRSRTWTVRPGAWRLTVPADAVAAATAAGPGPESGSRNGPRAGDDPGSGPGGGWGTSA